MVQVRTVPPAAILVVGLALTPACSLVKKAASGDNISRRDLVNAGDSARKDHERNVEDIARKEKQIERSLKEYEELRKDGRFSSATSREKNITRNLEELRELDGAHPLHAAAPQRIAEIKQTWSEERYAREVLAEKCSQALTRAKQSRMDERWSNAERGLTDYAKCRRKMVDAGVAAASIKDTDALALAEYGLYSSYGLQQATKLRKEGRFRYAVGVESGLEKHADYVAEIAPQSTLPAEIKGNLAKVRAAHRDPEEVKAERAKADFDAWSQRVNDVFDAEWVSIAAAEESARPLYEAAIAAYDAGKPAQAVKKLLSARQKYLSQAFRSGVAFDAAYAGGVLEKGLFYDISAFLARLHFDKGDKAKLYPELSVIKNGRGWLDKAEELQIRHYDILADRKGTLAPKPTEMVQRYAGRYSDVGREFKMVKEKADALRGEAYGLLGTQIETIDRSAAGYSTKNNIGKVVYMDEVVSSVSGSRLRFDYRGSSRVPTKCWSTNKISSVNAYTGRVSYQQRCKYKKVKTGYTILVPKPKGLAVKKGDKVALYATVTKKAGKFDVVLSEPGYVKLTRNGKTRWFLGATIK